MEIIWWRGGRTMDRYTACGNVRVEQRIDGSLALNFSMGAAGGGTTDVHISIHPENFDDLIAMMKPSEQTKQAESCEEELARLRQANDALRSENDALRSENEWLNSRILNESVRPDRVAEFREKALAAVIKAVTEA